MKDIAVNRLKDFFEDLMRDKKSLVKILSVILILLLAVIFRIHSAHKADINIETAAAKASVSDESSQGGEVNEGSDEINEEGEGSAAADASSPAVIYVDIGGAVAEPGVYQVAEGTRLFEVVEMAGGLTDKADTDSVNQAAYVEDGAKVIIPRKGSGDSGASGEEPLSSSSSSVSVYSSSSGSSSPGLININTASKEELTTLSGIGDVIAGRIIEYRSSKAFKSKEDIKSVKGIGDAVYDKIKDSITC